MQDLNDKVTGGTLTAVEWNEVSSELQNVIEALGITLSSGDLDQLGKGIAGYVANGDFYTDGGAANAYVLTVIGLKESAPAYTDGFRVRFVPGNDNTAASTVNVAGLGVKSIKSLSGGVVTAGEILSGQIVTLEFDSGNDWFILIPQPSALKAGRKNILFGNFRVNQRSVSGSVVLAAGEYGHDRFRAGSGGCTYTFATSAGITTITISAGTLEQEVEGVNIDTGGYILSWSGTAQGQINSGGFGASGVPVANLVAGTNATVEFNTGTLALPQLERGSFPTRFEWRPLSEESILCERYFEKQYGTNASGGTIMWMIQDATNTRRYNSNFRTTKRAIPTMTITGEAGGTITADDIRPEGFRLQSAASGGAGSTVLFTNWEADAEL